MGESVRIQRLRSALRVISYIFTGMFLSYYLLVLLDSSLISEGSIIATLSRWSPYNKAYEGMLVALYAVGGIFLWKASSNLMEHKSLIDFTILGNFSHVLSMLFSALFFGGEMVPMAGVFLFLGSTVVVLFWLRPRKKSHRSSLNEYAMC